MQRDAGRRIETNKDATDTKVFENAVKKGQIQSILVMNSHKESKQVKSSRNLQTQQILN